MTKTEWCMLIIHPINAKFMQRTKKSWNTFLNNMMTVESSSILSRFAANVNILRNEKICKRSKYLRKAKLVYLLCARAYFQFVSWYLCWKITVNIGDNEAVSFDCNIFWSHTDHRSATGTIQVSRDSLSSDANCCTMFARFFIVGHHL